jgi:hypothetical protein
MPDDVTDNLQLRKVQGEGNFSQIGFIHRLRAAN